MNADSASPQIEHYRYSVQWSSTDREFVATVAEFPSLSWLASDQVDALRGLQQLIATVIADLANAGEMVPEPLSDRAYSGRLNLRVSEALHRQLAVEAVRHDRSLNAYATELLERQLPA